MPPSWLDRYLDLLALDHQGEPSTDALFALHRAHVERIPYENIDIQLGRPPGIDPAESIERILAGRGGYCYNLNGAMATLLQALGYEVRWHRGEVHDASVNPLPAAYGNHLALTVDLDGTTWMVDAGLGDAHHEPIPLFTGEHTQGSFTFRLERTNTGGWRFIHDPAVKSFYGMDFSADQVTWRDFLHRHTEVSTSPTSSFVRHCQVHRRDSRGADSLVGCTLRRKEAGTCVERELTTAAEWFEAATGVLGLQLDYLTRFDRDALWSKNLAAHQAWRAAGT
jgi:arylamine N-acetyltransferase